MLQARSGTKFQLLPLFDIVWTPFGSNKELGGASVGKRFKMLTVKHVMPNVN